MIHYTVFADCGGAVYARDNSIEVLLFPKSKDEPDGLSATDLVNELRLAFISSVFFFLLFLIPNSILHVLLEERSQNKNMWTRIEKK